MKRTPKERQRIWFTGDAAYKQRWMEWNRNHGFIAEDTLRKLMDSVMEHGKVSFDVGCGYENSQSDNESH